LRDFKVPQTPPILTEINSQVYGLLRGEEEFQLPSDW
jgi:hypothetical protein